MDPKRLKFLYFPSSGPSKCSKSRLFLCFRKDMPHLWKLYSVFQEVDGNMGIDGCVSGKSSRFVLIRYLIFVFAEPHRRHTAITIFTSPFGNTFQKYPSYLLLNPLLEIYPSGNPPISPKWTFRIVSPLESASSF